MAVTSVTLGNFFTTSSGKTVLGGAGGSGLDTQALINSLVTVKSEPATQDQTQITANNAQASALTSFQSLLSTFQSAASALSNPAGVFNAANNVFDFTTGSVGNGGSNYVGVTTSPGAALQNYNISDISSVATAASQGTGVFGSPTADATTGAVSFGTGTLTFAGGEQVTVASGDSLNTIAAKFNAISSQSGITATVIQVDSTHSQLSFVSTATGTNADFDLTNPSFVTDSGGVLTNVGLTAAVDATDAKFKVNGVQIDRQSNSVNDVVSGVTFSILQTTPDSTTNYPVSISPDTTTIQNSIVNFVNAYNAIQTFATQQTQLNSDGTYASTAVLANNQTFRQIMSSLNSQIVGQVAGISTGSPSSLNDVGITLTNQPANGTTPAVNNILTVDDGELTSALSSNFQGVKNLFGFNLTSNDSDLAIYSHTDALTATNFTLNADPGTNTYTATFPASTGLAPVSLTATPIGGGATGYTLAGPSGSALDGLQLIYASTATATINVTATQGVADKINSSVNAAITANTGTLAVAQAGISKNNSTLQADITRVNAQVTQYQQQLLQQFAALESAISSTNTLLQSLNANSNAALVAAGQ